MSITFIIGWLITLASWVPKPFIKDERKRLGTNLILSGIAVGIFMADLIYRIFN
jgi:hypothetical protein